MVRAAGADNGTDGSFGALFSQGRSRSADDLGAGFNENSPRRCREAASGSDWRVKAAHVGRRRQQEPDVMKYMLMMNSPARRLRPVHELAEEGHRGAHRLHDGLHEEAAGRGRAGRRRGPRRADAGQAVRAGKDGKPITDGVFPESKEFLAGYWIVDVDSPERAYADRRRGVGGARARRRAASTCRSKSARS